jgi:hypothetical protein
VGTGDGHSSEGSKGLNWRDLAGKAWRVQQWASLLNPMGVAAPMMLMRMAPGALRALHLKDIRIGDGDNHVVISSDGTVSFKLDALKSEISVNEKDDSFTAQIEGLGVKHTKDGAWGVMASPGVNIGPLKLSAGLEATYNPSTGVIAPSGAYQIGLGHMLSTDGSIHEKWNPVTGDFTKEVSLGGEVGGYRHETVAVEHNDEFVSTTTTDTFTSGGVTVTNEHSQGLAPDGSYVDKKIHSEAISAGLGFDSRYIAIHSEDVAVTRSDVRTVTTGPDGRQTTTHDVSTDGPHIVRN